MPRPKTTEDFALARRLGAEISAARERRGLRQEDVAASAGVSQQVMSDYEAGRKLPSVPTLTALARILAGSLDHWLRPASAAGVAEPATSFIDARSEFLAIYDRLPPQATQALLEEALAWLARLHPPISDSGG